VSARDRLLASLAPELVDALEQLIDERLEAAPRGGITESPWLLLAEAAEYVRVSERTMQRLLKRGRVRSMTFGRRRLFHRDDLDAVVRAATGEDATASHVIPSPGLD
jgi:excisionase family DNA binding protein